MPKVEIKVGSQTYEGKTNKEATGKAIDHLTALFPEKENTWNPVIVRALSDSTGENVGIAFKDTTGFWAYRIDWADGHNGSVTSSNWTRQQAEFKLRQHLAQAAYRGGSQLGAARLETLQVIHPDDKDGAEEHLRWLRFQSAYENARASGLDDNAAHAQAGRVA